MPEIINKTNQRLLINLKSGKNIDLLARGTASVSEEDLGSSHLQNLLAKKKVIVSLGETKKKWKYESTEKTETDISGTGETAEAEVPEPQERTEEQPAEQVETVPEEVPEQPESKKTYRKKSK